MPKDFSSPDFSILKALLFPTKVAVVVKPHCQEVTLMVVHKKGGTPHAHATHHQRGYFLGSISSS